MSDDLDDLLQPTVASTPREEREKPWRVQSQFWVAFFGGALAAAAIALVNAHRLDIETRKRWWMVAASVVALAILVVLWLREPAAASFFEFLRGARNMRIAGRIVAVLLFLVLAALQKPAETHYLVFSKSEYASLWGPGIAATLILGTAQSLLMAGIAWLAHQ